MCAESAAWANTYACGAGTLCGLVPKCYDPRIEIGGDRNAQARPSDDWPDDAPDCRRARQGIHRASAARGQRPRSAAEEGGPVHLRHLHRRAHRREDRRCHDGPLPRPQGDRQLRRRLRLHRRGRRRQARRGRHQHARRADRGGGRHHARHPARHGARVLPGREVAARRPLGQGGRLSPHRVAARPLGRHRRPGPHRQGHRAALRGVRDVRSAISAATSRPMSATATIPTWWPWRATSIP